MLQKILQEIKNALKENTYYVKSENGINHFVVASATAQYLVEKIIKKHLSDNDGWIPVEEGMPKCEEEVWIITEKGTQTSAMYEDGTMLDDNSKWNWTDIDGEWDEEADCMIIPEGWWEYRHFNPDDVYNNPVDEKVIAWRPLPESYRKDGE